MRAALIAALIIVTMMSSTSVAHATEEDSPGWSCVTDGNRVCGPYNSENKPAGCYDDVGVMVAPWPCFVVIDRNGNGDIYTGH